MKKRINISLDEETLQKLKVLAANSHRNVSQWITDKIWETDVKASKKPNKNTEK